jgi:predicted CXXCH cytochrome family protein
MGVATFNPDNSGTEIAGSPQNIRAGFSDAQFVQADFNDTQYIHVGFDDVAKLTDAECRLVLNEIDLTVVAKALTDAKMDVLPKIVAVLSPEENQELQTLTMQYQTTVQPQNAVPKPVSAGGKTSFGKICPVRATDTQAAHAQVTNVMQKLAAEKKIDISFGQLFRFFKRGNHPMVECDNNKGKRETFEIKYTFGVRPLQQYLIEFDDGRVQCLPTAWDLEKKRWFHLYPKEQIHYNDPLHWTKSAQNWNYMCASCHSTDLKKHYDVDNNRYRTKWSEMSVGCQSCHGPCGLHVERMSIPGLEKTGNRETDMALPIFSKMNNRGEIETCAGCHAHRRTLQEGTQQPGEHFFDYFIPSLIDGNLFYADGQILEEDYEYTSFLQSRMSVENVRCTTCHDPHSSKLAFEGNKLCTQCHDASYDSPKHHHHEIAANDSVTSNTQSGTLCVDCHLPATTYMLVAPRHDHHIKSPDPELTIQLGIPNACNVCHNNAKAGETPEWALRWTRQWYGKKKAEAPEHYAFAISGGRTGDEQALPKLLAVANNRDVKQIRPIIRASAISLLGRYSSRQTLSARAAGLTDSDANVRLASATTFENATIEERLAHLLPLLTDKTYAVRCEAARLLSIVPPAQIQSDAKRQFDAALQEYIRSQDASLDHSASHLNLAVLWENLALPKITDAQQKIRRDVEQLQQSYYQNAAPQQIQALQQDLSKKIQQSQNSLIPLIRESTQKSLEEYRRAIMIDPDFFPARINLAMLHNFRAEPQSAEQELQNAVRIDPLSGEAFYSLGLLLAEQNRLADAETALDKAQSLLKNNPRVLYNHGLLLFQLRKTDAAEKQLLRAFQLDQTSTDVLQVLANISVEKKEYEKALGRIQLLQKLEPNNPEWRQLFNQVYGIYQSWKAEEKR